MPFAELLVPSRLLAGGGPGSPDPRVLRAMATPLIGQFDPDFTAIMDEVIQLGRHTFLTRNGRCFPVSGLAAAGLEALLNTLVEPGDRVCVGGGRRFVAETGEVARRYGADVADIEDLGSGATPKLVVLPCVDSSSGRHLNVKQVCATSHAAGARLILDATPGLGALELRVDDWGVDACVAGVDYAIGAPSGMALVTYSSELEASMHARSAPPPTSYLDLLQLQAYWSPERLNHHTAPTSLVYGLREALRLLHQEGLEQTWARHQRAGRAVRAGLEALDVEVGGDVPYTTVRLPIEQDEASARRELLELFGVHVRHLGPHTWGIGLLGADARLDAVMRVLSAVQEVLHKPRSGAVSAALSAYGAE
ncbi:MAG: aminotransferase class V-fold PLP-dependent enzyme [Chloroflexota bacterium]|nr:aminotransferase class V-fold PLP-dependent enzyme [Chloroflexota bacterium]